ncbi:hypothetical protein NQ318_002227 [Aromia moschata]|uniref:Uncharacterized protein n=1 Tax=Aromia moschata TaxID=1265417 RepID=A0AAV8Z4X6_9CUCU|nr:hypothetical protein NQ318_002227 [Aromia moschata]
MSNHNTLRSSFVTKSTVCVKPTSASYEKGQTKVRRQIRSNRIRIEDSEGNRPALSPPVLVVRTRSVAFVLFHNWPMSALHKLYSIKNQIF